MAQLHDVAGYACAPFSTDDLEEASVVAAAVTVHDRIPYGTPVEDLKNDLTVPGTDAAADTVAVRDSVGRLVAYGFVRVRPPSATEQSAYLWADVHPEVRRRGIGTGILDWQQRRLTERLAAEVAALPQIMKAWAEEHQYDRRALLEGHGFTEIRHFFDMGRPIHGKYRRAEPAAGFAVVDWDQNRSEEIRHVTNRAFEDHWGSSPQSPEDWEHTFMTHYALRADLSALAVGMDGEVVGYTMNWVLPEDFEIRGRTEGHIASLGVLRECRKRGIASALITESLSRFQREGYQFASLSVDGASQTGALGLYERLGFVVEHRSMMLAKTPGQR